jgi:hypothetical protein
VIALELFQHSTSGPEWKRGVVAVGVIPLAMPTSVVKVKQVVVVLRKPSEDLLNT